MESALNRVVLIPCGVVRDAGTRPRARDNKPRIGKSHHTSEDQAVMREKNPETGPRLGQGSSGCVRTRVCSVSLETTNVVAS